MKELHWLEELGIPEEVDAPAFGGINLEDIASPKCFYVFG